MKDPFQNLLNYGDDCDLYKPTILDHLDLVDSHYKPHFQNQEERNSNFL